MGEWIPQTSGARQKQRCHLSVSHEITINLLINCYSVDIQRVNLLINPRANLQASLLVNLLVVLPHNRPCSQLWNLRFNLLIIHLDSPPDNLFDSHLSNHLHSQLDNHSANQLLGLLGYLLPGSRLCNLLGNLWAIQRRSPASYPLVYQRLNHHCSLHANLLPNHPPALVTVVISSKGSVTCSTQTYRCINVGRHCRHPRA